MTVRTISTSDLSLAAFYMGRGLKLAGVNLNPGASTSIDCTFLFEDPDKLTETMLLEYAASIEARHDSNLRALRKVCSDMRQRERELRAHSRNAFGARR